ncbi:dihydroorotase, partial [Salmonella enterica subsp. enterica serovar Infantis]|nr:dihydroorotase [Salmonella enterica subsp. enterica serovar Infantis]
QSMQLAPFGIVGLETAFPLLYTNFVKTGVMTLQQLMDYLTVKPAQSFKLDMGTLEAGKKADIVILDLEETNKIDPETFLSKGRNTPFAGWECQGWPVATIVSGKIAWRKESVHA